MWAEVLTCLLAASLAHASLLSLTVNKKYIVCKRQQSQVCLAVLFTPENVQIINNEVSAVNIHEHCGYSDLRPLTPHRQFIEVTNLSLGEPVQNIFCRRINLVDVERFKQEHRLVTSLNRLRRQLGYIPRGRYRGQTQSQYLSIDRGNSTGDDGKAEALSAADSSRASVSGRNGMGQAQSQTIYIPSCDNCVNSEPENLSGAPYGQSPSNYGVNSANKESHHRLVPYGRNNASVGNTKTSFDGTYKSGPQSGGGYTVQTIPDNADSSHLQGREPNSNSAGPIISSWRDNGPSIGVPGVHDSDPRHYNPGSPGTIRTDIYNPLHEGGSAVDNGHGGPQLTGALNSRGDSQDVGSNRFGFRRGDSRTTQRGDSGGGDRGGGGGGGGRGGSGGGGGGDDQYRYGNRIFGSGGERGGGGLSAGPLGYFEDMGGHGNKSQPTNFSTPPRRYTQFPSSTQHITNRDRDREEHRGSSGDTEPSATGSDGTGTYGRAQGSREFVGRGTAASGELGAYGTGSEGASGVSDIHRQTGAPGSAPILYNVNNIPYSNGNRGQWPVVLGNGYLTTAPSGQTYVCCVVSQGVPGAGGQAGQYAPSTAGQWIPVSGGQTGQFWPTTAGQRVPGAGGQAGQSWPSTSGQGVPSTGGQTGQYAPSTTGQWVPGAGGQTGQYLPSTTGQGVPGAGGQTGQYLPSTTGQGVPGAGGQTGQYLPSTTGQGVPGAGGQTGQYSPSITSHVVPGAGGQIGQFGPSTAGQGTPGAGGQTVQFWPSTAGQGIPSTGGQTGQYAPGTTGQWVPGAGGQTGQYLPSTTGQGVPGASGQTGQYLPSSTGQGIPGAGGQTGQYIPSTTGQGVPGASGQTGQYLPSTTGQGVPGASGQTGQYLPSSTGQGIPGAGGQTGQYIPSTTGQGVPGASGQTGQYLPSTTGQGIPGAGGQTGQYLPSTTGQGVPGAGGQTGPYLPSTTGQGVPGAGGQTGPYLPSTTSQGIPGAGGQTGQYFPITTGQGVPGASGQTGQYLPSTTGQGIPGAGGQTGQYIPSTTGQGVPGAGGQTGQYLPSNTGQGVPGAGGQTGPYFPITTGQGVPGASGQTGQYLPSTTGQGVPGAGGQTGQYIPSTTGQWVPGASGQTGQYLPSTTSQGVPGAGGQTGQYFPITTGQGVPGANGQTGQYLPSTTGQGVPGAGGQTGQYIPSTTGQVVPGASGQTGQYLPSTTGQGVPGAGGQTGPYLPSTTSQGIPGAGGQTGQYLPSTTSQGVPGAGGQTGQYLPSNTGQGVPGAGGQTGPYLPSTTSQGVPGASGQTGQYLPSTTGQGVPGAGGQTGQYLPSTTGQGVPGAGGQTGPYLPSTTSQGVPGAGGQTGQYVPSATGQGVPAGIPQNVVDLNSINLLDDDSEALASVSQDVNGTVASASSKGGNEKGKAQTQVQGTYTGSGSFSATAQISDENKGADSQVTGGKEGASSSAQGRGRNNKSQVNVQLGSETGSLLTHAQSDGHMHSSNSQVQGSVKGGMADAQARGPGSTSSQAQIGFTPYKDGDKSHERYKTPFVGGGTASAQSSGRTGQSQSILEGTFKYGITYNGAAQAGSSIDKDAVFSNRLPFNKIDVFDQSNKNINVDNVTLDAVESRLTDQNEKGVAVKTSEGKIIDHSQSDHHKVETQTPINNRRSFQHKQVNSNDFEYTPGKDDIPSDDYDPDGAFGTDGRDLEQGEYSNYDEIQDSEPTHQSVQSSALKKGLEVQQSNGRNTQHIVLGPLRGQDAEIIQRSSEQQPDESRVYQPGERVPGTGGYTIPLGFTGSVKSVSSKGKTYAIGSKDSPSQAQTVALSPGTGKIKYVHPNPVVPKNINPKDLRSLYNSTQEDRYISVSKSVTGALDSNNNVKKQYSHTYYTKASTCGYFTFTCTIVSGTNGRTKVCKPKIPTNPDGSPMKC